MSDAVCLPYSSIGDGEIDGSSPLYSLLSPKELKQESCFDKLIMSAGHLDILKSLETDPSSASTGIIIATF